MRFAGVVVAGLALAGMGGGAGAQDCPHAPAIVALSNIVLDKRTALPAIQARRFGSVPAYLILHYGDLDEAQGTAMVDGLVAGRVHSSRDLMYARAIALGGLDAVGDEAYADALSVSYVSTARALLLHGGAERLFAEIAARENPAREFGTVMIAVLDQSDAFKEGLVDTAMKANLPHLAAGLAATYADRAKWDAFAETLDAETRTLTQDFWRWAPAMVGLPELPRSTPPRDPAISEQFHNLMITAALEPQLDFLLPLVNITGEIAKVSPVGEMLRAAIESGQIDRRGTFDDAWLAAYRALIESWGNVPQLRGFLSDITLQDGWIDRVSVLDAVEWMDAVDVLTPYARGETDVVPEPPFDLSFVWPWWITAADAVRAGGVPEFDDKTIGRIAELLHVVGRDADLATLLAAAEPSGDVIEIAVDFAKRLDRTCDAALQHPAEALQLPGQVIFKFD